MVAVGLSPPFSSSLNKKPSLVLAPGREKEKALDSLCHSRPPDKEGWHHETRCRLEDLTL